MLLIQALRARSSGWSIDLVCNPNSLQIPFCQTSIFVFKTFYDVPLILRLPADFGSLCAFGHQWFFSPLTYPFPATMRRSVAARALQPLLATPARAAAVPRAVPAAAARWNSGKAGSAKAAPAQQRGAATATATATATASQPIIGDTTFMGMTGGAIVHEMLRRHGVKTVFGYPGGAILPVFDAIHESPHFRFILPRHEQGAGHMAEGYARARWGSDKYRKQWWWRGRLHERMIRHEKHLKKPEKLKEGQDWAEGAFRRPNQTLVIFCGLGDSVVSVCARHM